MDPHHGSPASQLSERVNRARESAIQTLEGLALTLDHSAALAEDRALRCEDAGRVAAAEKGHRDAARTRIAARRAHDLSVGSPLPDIVRGARHVDDRDAKRREWAAYARELDADERDRVADERDQIARWREADADQRERDADERERAADERDRVADERDRVAIERDSAADGREHIADDADSRVIEGLQEQAQIDREVRASTRAMQPARLDRDIPADAGAQPPESAAG